MHWLAGRRLGGLWIMPDEAIYAERALAVYRHGTLPLLHGEGAGYGVLYPLLAGIPLSLGSFSHAYALLKAVQALVVSLAAVPVYLYARHRIPTRYALVAATLTVASPLLLYSGLVMTEVLFYPLAALALLLVARAVETGNQRHQLVALVLIAAAVLTRVQAVIFLPVFTVATLLDALLVRSTARLRGFWPVWTVTIAAGVVGLSVPGLFGSYAGTVRGSYPIADALGLTFDHASYLILSTGIVPAVAMVLLLLRPRTPAERALATVTTSATVLIVVQVGFFAARYSPHLLGRDLAALPPLLFLTFAAWLSPAGPRRLGLTTACAFAVLCFLLLAPWNHLVTANALPDSFGIALLYRLHENPTWAVTIGSLVVLTLVVILPRRSALILPALVLTFLVASSLIASNQIASAVTTNQQNIVGAPANWIDRIATGPVAYIYDGETYWNTVWQETFWNQKINHVLSLTPAVVPGPMPQTRATPSVAGALPLNDHWVVASNRLTFIGTPAAHLTQTNLDVSGLTLWHVEGQPRISTVENSVLPNGDIEGSATVVVYDCRGSLELTLLPKETKVLRVLFDGVPVFRAELTGSSWTGSIPARPATGPTACEYTILAGPLLGSTRIAFDRS